MFIITRLSQHVLLGVNDLLIDIKDPTALQDGDILQVSVHASRRDPDVVNFGFSTQLIFRGKEKTYKVLPPRPGVASVDPLCRDLSTKVAVIVKKRSHGSQRPGPPAEADALSRLWKGVTTKDPARLPLIVGLYDKWWDEKAHYVVTRVDKYVGNIKGLVSYRELFDEVGLMESFVRGIARQVLQALRFIHARGEIHCGLRPSSIQLFRSEELKDEIKAIVADFEHCVPASASERQNSVEIALSGRLEYTAPEIHCSPRADIWAFGAIIFFALAGVKAFDEADAPDMLEKAESGHHWSTLMTRRPGLSADALSFLKQCLTVDVAARPTAAEMLDHPWLSSSEGGAFTPASHPTPSQAESQASPPDGALPGDVITPRQQALLVAIGDNVHQLVEEESRRAEKRSRSVDSALGTSKRPRSESYAAGSWLSLSGLFGRGPSA
ncbi:unnamed protein product [Peniophora sp. CBMAI 1063]|nr:unnamed protein product [Peniophora sp. CBMAI 1063]